MHLLIAMFHSEPTQTVTCEGISTEKRRKCWEVAQDGLKEQLVVFSLPVYQKAVWLLPSSHHSSHLVEECQASKRHVLICDADWQAHLMCASGLAGSLHDDVTLLQVHNFIPPPSYLHNDIFFPSTIFIRKKKKTSTPASVLVMQLPCISGSLPCSYFLCVTSQNSKIYSVNDFQ